MPDDQEIVGITEHLVEKEHVSEAAVALDCEPQGETTFAYTIPNVETLDKVR